MRDIHRVADLTQLIEFIKDSADPYPIPLPELQQIISTKIRITAQLKHQLLGCKCRISRFTADRLARELIDKHYG